MLKFCANAIVIGIVLIEHSHSAATGTAAMDQQQHSSVTLDLPFKINEDCHQPRETGRCFALFHRFAFNVEKRTCEEFIYGGCGGNKNNFETLNDCENMCRILADDELVTTTTAASSSAATAPLEAASSPPTTVKQLSDTDTESSTATIAATAASTSTSAAGAAAARTR